MVPIRRMTAYRARPIDASHLSDGRHAQALADLDEALRWRCVTYLPDAAWSVPSGTLPQPILQGINNVALMNSDVLVAVMTDAPSLGVGREVERARANGKPVLVVAPSGVSRWAAADCDVLDLDSPDLVYGLNSWLNKVEESLAVSSIGDGES